jgi:hypothetical protein
MSSEIVRQGRQRARKLRELLDILNEDSLDLELEAASNREYYEQCRREAALWSRRNSGSGGTPVPS